MAEMSTGMDASRTSPRSDRKNHPHNNPRRHPHYHHLPDDLSFARRRRPKKSKPNNTYCGCGRTECMASAVICFLVFYGIFMAAYILLFDDGIHHKKLRRDRSKGRTKEEQRNYLQGLQQKALKNVFTQRTRGRNREEEEIYLEKFLQKKKISKFQRKYPKMIHFLHIHKSAGTFLCKQAFKNKMAADYDKNCNVRHDQKCCWYNGEKGSWNHKVDMRNETRLVEESVRFAETAPFDFVATEKELSGPMLVDHYDYVVTLRNSRSRYKSHWQHLLRGAQDRRGRKPAAVPARYLVSGQTKNNPPSAALKEENLAAKNNHNNKPGRGHRRSRWADTGEDPEDDPGHWNFTVVNPKDGTIHPVGNFTKWISGQPDNYSLRMICGSPCVNIPKYQITKELFDHSLERLWVNFSHILFVEDMEASFARFANAYGWDPDTSKNETPKKKAAKKTLAKTPSKRYDQNVTSTLALSADPFMTVLDDALYEFAQRKYKGVSESTKLSLSLQKPVWNKDYAPFQNQDLVDSYFEKGPSVNCTNPCCGYCSKW